MNIKAVICLCLIAGSLGELWNPTGERSKRHQEVKFRIDLLKRNPEWLDKTLEAVSDPNGPMYEVYMTNEDIKQNIGRSDREIKSVIRFFKKQCASLCPLSGEAMIHNDFIKIKTCAARYECIFDTELVRYKHPLYEKYIFHSAKTTYDLEARLKELNAPLGVRSIITGINKVGRLPPPLKYHGEIRRAKDDSTLPFEGDKVDPLIIRKNYGTDAFSTDTSSNNSQNSNCMIEFNSNYFKPSDIQVFQSHYNLPTNPLVQIIGNNDPDSGGASLGEATLDSSYLTTVIDQDTWGFFDGDWEFDFASFTQDLMNTANAPKIVSISYGNPESNFGDYNMNQCDDEFKKLGILKFTIFISSGDSGVGNTGYFWCGNYEPDYPTASPYVVSVGGTYLSDDFGGEQPWNDGGGGFSNHNSRPSWQDDAVTKYLSSSNLPSSSLYNSSGRGYPDFSGYATNLRIYYHDAWNYIGGTSASCPITAAVFTAINIERQRNGKGPLGYITPQIYQHGNDAGAFGYDVTSGYNYQPNCAKAFPAHAGWDAATGFGSVKYDKLLEIFG